MSSPLPEFEHPPVDEVVIGLQFAPVARFTSSHFGLYWQRIKDRYPSSEDQPPLAPQLERNDIAPLPTTLAFRTGLPMPRCWFLDETGNNLIQVQNERFLANWRRVKGDEEYPRFAHLIDRFRKEWQAFLEFAKEQDVGELNVNQCEVSYINHFEPGKVWKDFSELPKVFTNLRIPEGTFLPAPELQSWESRFKLPEGKGRLHIEAQPAFRARDLKMILALSLTARGNPGQGTPETLFAWFDLAHEWIVRGFDQITQSAMHEQWGRKNA